MKELKESLWNKDGLLFKFNYGYTLKKPEQVYTTRCQLFWRTVIWSFIALFIYGIVKLSRTEIGLLFREHLTEKTRNWCPTVRFVSKDELKKVDFSQQSD